MSTYALRKRFIEIARADVGKVEVTKNVAPWIAKLWTATSYPDGMKNRAPYCAAGMCYDLMRWLSSEDVLKAFGFTPKQAEKWRCKSSSVFRNEENSWLQWAQDSGLMILPKKCILHMADIVIYNHSHIAAVSDDDGTLDGPFVDIGYNTNAAGSRDGEGCFEKPRSRSNVKCFIRMLQ